MERLILYLLYVRGTSHPTRKVWNCKDTSTSLEEVEGQIWSEVAAEGHAVLLSAPQPSETDITSQLWHSFLLISDTMVNQAVSTHQCCWSQEDCCCCYSVAKSYLTLCNPMDCSTPGFPVIHYLLEFAQIHVHWVSDAIKPSHPLSFPSPLVLSLSQNHGLFQWVGFSHQVAKVLEFQLQHQSFKWTSRTDLL